MFSYNLQLQDFSLQELNKQIRKYQEARETLTIRENAVGVLVWTCAKQNMS